MSCGYIVISILTVPGAVMRALLQYIFCILCKTEIKSGRVLRMNRYFGHIEHEETSFKSTFIISFFPSLILFILGTVIAFPACAEIFTLGKISVISCILLYGGVSFLANACPFYDDAERILKATYNKETKVAKKILLSPVVAPMFASAWLSYNCVKIVFSVLFCIALPHITALFIGTGF